MSAATMTGSTMTQNGYAGVSQIGGIAGLAVRLGRALELWGRRAAEPLTREQQEQRIAIEREARQAIEARNNAHMYQLLRWPMKPFTIEVAGDVLDDLRSRLTRSRFTTPSGAGWNAGTDQA